MNKELIKFLQKEAQSSKDYTRLRFLLFFLPDFMKNQTVETTKSELIEKFDLTYAMIQKKLSMLQEEKLIKYSFEKKLSTKEPWIFKIVQGSNLKKIIENNKSEETKIFSLFARLAVENKKFSFIRLLLYVLPELLEKKKIETSTAKIVEELGASRISIATWLKVLQENRLVVYKYYIPNGKGGETRVLEIKLGEKMQ